MWELEEMDEQELALGIRETHTAYLRRAACLLHQGILGFMCFACFDPWENLLDSEWKFKSHESLELPISISKCSEVRKCLPLCLLNRPIHYTTLKTLTLLCHREIFSRMQSSEVKRFLNVGN